MASLLCLSYFLTILALATGQTCQDDPIYADRCSGWLQYCINSRYSDFMSRACPLSCGFCQECTCSDHPAYLTQCPAWKTWCSRSEYVSTRCPATCKTCQCCEDRTDKQTSCQYWEEKGYCDYTQYQAYMYVNCYKSCSCGSCQCGKKKTRRIVGGQETEVNEYPWMGALLKSEGGSYLPICGSSLVAANWVITASHCFFDTTTGVQTLSESGASILLGGHDFNDLSDSINKIVGVEKIIFHTSYNFQTSYNDIALLKLSVSVDINVYTPVCLPSAAADYTNKTGWVYGWGSTVIVPAGAQAPAGSTSSVLLEVEVTVVLDDTCRNAMGQNTISDSMLCAGGVAGKDSCAGDSGGPFTVEVNSKHELAGVVSFGFGCAQEGLYGVYTETAKFRTWIDQQMAANGGAIKCD